MDEEDIGEHLAGQTIQANSGYSRDELGSRERQHLQTSLGAAPDELFITANTSGKGYQLLKAMGFKDRGHSKFCFKGYESDSELDDDENEEDELDVEKILSRQE